MGQNIRKDRLDPSLLKCSVVKNLIILFQLYPRNVGDHLKGDSTAGYGAARGHPFEKVVGKTLAAWVNVDTDPFPQDELHVGRVAELNHHSNRQIYPLLRPHATSTQLRTLVDSGVP